MRRVTWYWWAAMLASCLTTGITAVIISLHAQAESERKLCGLITTMDDSYRESPAQTPAGRRIQAGVADLRRDLGCP